MISTPPFLTGLHKLFQYHNFVESIVQDLRFKKYTILHNI